MSIIEHVTLQKIVAHDFRYDPRILSHSKVTKNSFSIFELLEQEHLHLTINTSTSFRNPIHCSIDDICHFDSGMEVYLLSDTDNHSLAFYNLVHVFSPCYKLLKMLSVLVR